MTALNQRPPTADQPPGPLGPRHPRESLEYRVYRTWADSLWDAVGVGIADLYDTIRPRAVKPLCHAGVL